MEGDISKALTYQVKREIAEKYFGYRKIIEEDKQNLQALLEDLRRFYEERLGMSLVRLFVLLKDQELINEFLERIQWPDASRQFFDEYMVHSKTIEEKLLKDLEKHGWTSRGKFINLVLDSYQKLLSDTATYKDKYEECLEEAEIINEEIKQFEEKFALDEILSFISSLDARDDLVSAFGENLPLGHMQELASKQQIEKISIENLAPKPPSLPPLKDIKGRLKALAEQAYYRRN